LGNENNQILARCPVQFGTPVLKVSEGSRAQHRLDGVDAGTRFLKISAVTLANAIYRLLKVIKTLSNLKTFQV
jgi:hypothetical protein